LLIWEKQLGHNHPDVASTLTNLAKLYQRQGDFSRSEPLFVRSLAIREEFHGIEHPDVAISLKNLAELYRDAGNRLYKRALQILEKTLGANHPEVVEARKGY
jgi:tetratricopeptide (TPR) repeat protein